MPVSMAKIDNTDARTKTRELLLYLLQNNAKSSITSLMKLAYLADVIAVKKLKRQISEFEYKRHHYGPFDKKIYTYIEELTENNLVKAESDYGLTGEEFSVFFINPDKEKDVEFHSLQDDEKAILDELLASVRGYGAKMLTEIAYKTKPMTRLNATIGGSEHLGETLDLAS